MLSTVSSATSEHDLIRRLQNANADPRLTGKRLRLEVGGERQGVLFRHRDERQPCANAAIAATRRTAAESVARTDVLPRNAFIP